MTLYCGFLPLAATMIPAMVYMAPLQQPCGLTFCDLQGFGRYCDDGQCWSCERYFHSCELTHCQNLTIPDICLVKIFEMKRSEEAEDKDEKTYVPLMGREYAMIAVIVMLAIATFALVASKCWKARKCCSQRRGGDNTPSSDSSVTSMEQEPLCYGEKKLKGVDETGDATGKCVTSKDDYGKQSIAESAVDEAS